MKISRQTSAKLVQARKQLFHSRFFTDFKGPGTDQVKIDFFALFQIKRLHQTGRKPYRQRITPFLNLHDWP